MKTRLKILILILFIFSFFPISVFAESLGEKFVNFTISGFEFLFGDGFTGVKDFSDYDPRVSLFDGLENSIPVCDNEIEYTNKSYCKSGTVPDIKKIIEDYPYLIRFKITDNSTNNFYYIFGFYESDNVSSYECYGENSTCFPVIKSPKFTISMLPTADKDSSFYNNFTSYPYVFPSFHPSSPYSSILYIPFSVSRPTSVSGNQWYYFYTKTNDNYSVELDTNFNLVLDGLTSNFVNGPIFDSNIDITIKPGYYVDLIPKGTDDFSSHIYTNNFIYFDYSIYDRYNKTYSSVNSGALNQINFSALGGYNWLYWNIDFDSTTMSLNPIVSIFNPYDTDLIVKIRSQDFYYRIRNKESSEYCINDICYVNRYENLYNNAHSYTYTSDFYDEDYNSGLSFVKKLPNMIKDFTKSFSFIGTLFVSFFTIFNGSIANYFYIIFGLMIIMIIIKILK